MRANLDNLQAMRDRPLPNSLKALWGFLSLIGYYLRFIKGCGGIAVPLTRMLKKDGFHWNEEAKVAFYKLKEPVT